MTGDADDCRALLNGAQNNRSSADSGVLADGDVAENLCAITDDDVILNRGMTLDAIGAGAAEGYAGIDRDVIADHRGFADDHTHTVVDEETATNFRAGMDFDSGQEARQLGHPARQEEPTAQPQFVSDAMNPDSVQSGIAKIDFSAGSRRGVVFQHVGDVLAN